nr:MAG: hypothetical protein DIU78_24775 [Pseudomonadota bacterium]
MQANALPDVHEVLELELLVTEGLQEISGRNAELVLDPGEVIFAVELRLHGRRTPGERQHEHWTSEESDPHADDLLETLALDG